MDAKEIVRNFLTSRKTAWKIWEYATYYKYNFVEEAIDIAIQEAKKEVFDDVETLIGYKSLKDRQDRLNELKKRHLSTFADGKSDTIADKQNPPDILSDLKNEYDLGDK